MRIDVEEVADHERGQAALERAREYAKLLLGALGNGDDQWRPLLLLLVRVQNRYWPFIGPYTAALNPKTREYVDPVGAERRRFVARRALEELGLKREDVRDFHERLSSFAVNEDPIPNWWILRRLASRSQREQMKGAARRVEDIWEATQALRLFYHQLTRRVLPDANAVGTDPEWQLRVLGHKPRLYYDQTDLLRFLTRTGLYPHQVHLFVEGDSEDVMVRRLIQARLGQLEEWGIRVTNLGGIGNIHERHQELFAGFAEYARAPVLIADNEGDIGRYVGELLKEKLINREAVLLWEKNLEEDNFTDEQLVRAARRVARTKGGKIVALSGRGVRAALVARQAAGKASSESTFTRELIRLAASPTHGSVRFSKPELAEALTALLLDEVNVARSWDAVAQKRPILRHVSVIVQLARGAVFPDDPKLGGI
jgi:hypothetical protein